MRIGLFFGSFNPIHIGHLIIASYLVEHSDLDEIWLVITPHNPFKQRASLADDYIRLEMVNKALEDHPKLKASNVEFDLPQPSYTIDTLTYLKEEQPEHDFVLIMGGDNLKGFHRWKNYEQILKYYEILVYQRPNYDLGSLQNHPKIHILEDAPLMQISSTFIRKMIKANKSICYWVPKQVAKIIESVGLYQ